MSWCVTRLIFLISVSGALAMRCSDNNGSLIKVMDLPAAVQETSGLASSSGRFYTHNDSGDGPFVYVIDTVHQNISKKVRLKGASNTDWEDISASAGKLYIADTGNNTTSRSKYRLYIISTETLDTCGTSTGEFEEITFTFRNEKGKKKKVNSEAMMVLGDTCFFLSKETGKSEIYRLDPSTDEAVLTGKITLPFEATGWARISENEFAVCGYRKIGSSYYMSDVVILRGNISHEESLEIELLNLDLTGQFEGIAYQEGKLFLTSEGSGISSGKLYMLNYR